MSPLGEVFDGAGVELASEPYVGRIGVASNGSDYLVVWDDYFEDVYARRVSSAGVLQDSAKLVVSKGDGAQSAPSVASNGTDYLVAWQDNRTAGQWDVYANRVTAAGVVQDGGGGRCHLRRARKVRRAWRLTVRGEPGLLERHRTVRAAPRTTKKVAKIPSRMGAVAAWQALRAARPQHWSCLQPESASS